jgi:ADP-ribosylglycohydrolase
MAILHDHEARMQRAFLSIDGLSIGDAFGERFFVQTDRAEALILGRALPKSPWKYTDDTEMALAIVAVLDEHGGIDQDVLARTLVYRWARESGRGYGAGAHELLHRIALGADWRVAAPALFDGGGSMGNGAAMRVAPVGAYFADDLDAVVTHARASAEVTHAHPDGQAGAIAVAVAAALACAPAGESAPRGRAMLNEVRSRTPGGPTHEGIGRAIDLPDDASVIDAVRALGSGQKVISSDTVPFALWCAARFHDQYEEALWNTVEGLGDRDTTCAIVGGIVALSAGRDSIPDAWLVARERLRMD